MVTPFGRTRDAVWDALMAGQSAVAPYTLTNVANGATLTIPAARVPTDAVLPLEKTLSLMTDRFAQLAIQAADDAISDAAIDLSSADVERCGVASGSCMNGITETEVGFATLFVRQRPKVHPFTLIRTMPNAPAAYIALRHQLAGPVLHYSTTCSSSAVAIGEAARYIRHGYADVMLAGGTETLIVYSAVNCWHACALLAPLAAEPSKSCRPFDAERAGAVLGEGAVFLLLEAEEQARARGATALAEIAGYACRNDSAHVTKPSSAAQVLPMRAALLDAGIESSNIGYVHAHGTGTVANDAAEARAIRTVFADCVDSLPVSSSKGAVGHMIGAAGAFGAWVALEAIRRSEVPPTINLDHYDPACDLDFVPHSGRSVAPIAAALVNTFGFGGTSASLVLSRA